MRPAPSVLATCCVLALALGCSSGGDRDQSTGATTTAPASSTTSGATSTTSRTGSSIAATLTWTGRGFADLEWGADRATTVAALTELLGEPSDDQPGICGQYVAWRDPNVQVEFTDDGRFGRLGWRLTDVPHASGVGAGDPIGELQAAEPDGTWQVFGTNGLTGSTGPQQWQLRVGDVVTLGLATGPAPDGQLEGPVSQYSTVHEVPPCGD